MRKLLIAVLLINAMVSMASAQGFGEPTYVRSVYFRGGSSYVDSFQSFELMQFVDSIPNIHNFIITVHSHTDNIGEKNTTRNSVK